jgi:Ni,Fe-hydrogenase III component G
MEQEYKLSGDNKNSAYFFLLVELYAQNCVFAEMLIRMYAKSEDKEITDVMQEVSEKFWVQKKKCRDFLGLHFRDIDLDEILKGKTPGEPG